MRRISLVPTLSCRLVFCFSLWIWFLDWLVVFVCVCCGFNNSNITVCHMTHKDGDMGCTHFVGPKKLNCSSYCVTNHYHRDRDWSSAMSTNLGEKYTLITNLHSIRPGIKAFLFKFASQTNGMDWRKEMAIDALMWHSDECVLWLDFTFWEVSPKDGWAVRQSQGVNKLMNWF